MLDYLKRLSEVDDFGPFVIASRPHLIVQVVDVSVGEFILGQLVEQGDCSLSIVCGLDVALLSLFYVLLRGHHGKSVNMCRCVSKCESQGKLALFWIFILIDF